MKKVILFLSIALFTISCKTGISTLTQMNLKGDVYQINEKSFHAVEDSGTYQAQYQASWGNTLYTFNEYGNIVERQTLSNGGYDEGAAKYTYNRHHICTGVTKTFTYEPNSKEVNIIKSNKIIAIQHFDEDNNTTERHQLQYTEDNITQATIYNNEDKIIRSIELKYENGHITEQKDRDSLNEIVYSIKYSINDNGDLSQMITSGTIKTIRYTYEYDENNNWIKRYEFNGEDRIRYIVSRDISYFSDYDGSKEDLKFTEKWYLIDGDEWFDIRNNHTFELGSGNSTYTSGMWALDTTSQRLTFRMSDTHESREYRYDFLDTQLILYSKEENELLRLEKR